VSFTAISLGVTSLVTQIILLREFLSVFFGNELVIGVLLANWMLLTGLGSYLGRFVGRDSAIEKTLIPLLLSLAVVPPLTVFLLRYLRNLVFPVGTMIGVVPIIWSSLVLLAPFCLLSGSSFSILAARASRDDRGMIGAVYASESIGSVAGGILFSLLLIHFLNTFQSLTVVMALNLVVALAVGRKRRCIRVALWLVALLLVVPAIFINLDLMTKRFLFPEQELIDVRDTPYGSLAVTRQSEQQNFYENSQLLSSTNDVSTSEEAVHFAMVQHKNPRMVLMVSGAIPGSPLEVLKYGVTRLDYVELNPY
jgi:spermidine synthase